MRAVMHWAAALVVGWSFIDPASTAHAEISIRKANGQPVPEGAASKAFNPSTGGWDIWLLQLYAPNADTVFEVHASGGETIDNVFIAVDGPAAGSPVIVRLLGDAPGHLRSVGNVIQLGNAETILNKVVVTEDIGSVQVQAMGDLVAGRDVYGPISATTPDNSIRGITSVQAARHILGDVTAANGRILLVWAQGGNVGSPGEPIHIEAKFNVYQVMGKDVYAHINTRVNGGTGGFWAMVAERFFGTLETEKLIFNQYNSVDGLIKITQQFDGNISVGKSFNSAAQYIELPLDGLTGQIVINADGAAGGAWTAPVRIGPQGHPEQIVLTGPTYPHLPEGLGGGSVGLVPFRLHEQACEPPNGTIAEVIPNGPPLVVRLRHFGPVRWTGNFPATIDRRPAGSASAFTPVPSTEFAASPALNDSNVLMIGPAAGQAGFAPGFQYRIRPAAQLVCDVKSAPPVLWTSDYLVTVIIPPCDGDINADYFVNINDMLLVISFWGPVNPIFPAPDIDEDGLVNINDLLLVIANWGACW